MVGEKRKVKKVNVSCVGILKAARHAHHIEPALNTPATHIPCPAIVQTKKITAYALWVDTPSGSSSLMLLGMFGIGAAYTVIVRQTPDMRLRSVKEESDASRLLSQKKFSL